MEHYAQECIGVTDGDFEFTPDLAAVMGKISEENRWVSQQTDKPSVSVAYWIALDQKDPASVGLRHQLQGAYLAQRRVNRAVGRQPLIRLLVANAGKENEQWKPVVTQLLGKAGAPDRLVAVAGLGRSFEATRQAITEQADHRMPMIASTLTADSFSLVPEEQRVRGLVRASATNSDQVKATVAYLKPDDQRALLIQDTNKEDLYVRTLGEAFTAEFPDPTHTLIEPERYDSSLGGVANAFAQMMPNICVKRPDVVYFAGRGGSVLQSFLEALPGRPCLDFRIKVVTGNSAVHTANWVQSLPQGEWERRIGSANVTLRYGTLAHPGAWAASPTSFSPEATRYFQQDCADCFTSLFPGGSLDDGSAIMAHDAVVTAVQAIWDATGQRDLSTDPLTLGQVIQALGQLHDLNAVPGASGWLSFDGNGNPVDKAVTILELKPDGTVGFVKLIAPRGAPFTSPAGA